jgi:hypothetical protein
MPTKDHAVFIAPTNKEVTIWRYLDLSKFVSMLATSSLFFARADCLGDPLEGSSSRPSVANRPELIADFAKEHGAVGDIESESRRMAGIISQTQQEQLKRTYVNCWHMNEHESAAMWRLYAKSDEAIAIKSRYSTLVRCIDEHCYVGQIVYLDYEVDPMPQGNALIPFVCKRMSFEHEHELRAVTTLNSADGKAHPTGIQKSVDLNALIETVYVSPLSATWFKETVMDLTQKYGLQKQVLQSNLLVDPVY